MHAAIRCGLEKSFSSYAASRTCGPRFERPPKPAWSLSGSSGKTKDFSEQEGEESILIGSRPGAKYVTLSAGGAESLWFCQKNVLAGRLKVTSCWMARSPISPLDSYPKPHRSPSVYREVDNHSKTDNLKRISNVASCCTPHWLLHSSHLKEFFFMSLIFRSPEYPLLFPPLHQLGWLAIQQQGC